MLVDNIQAGYCIRASIEQVGPAARWQLLAASSEACYPVQGDPTVYGC